MVHSYLDNVEYGYDQINVGSSEFNHVLNTLDTNNIHNIDTVREREIRMFNKLNEYQPLQTTPIKKLTSYNYCRPDLFSLGGEQHVQLRHNIKENDEDYHYGSGNNFKDQINYYTHSNKQEKLGYTQDLYQKQTPRINSNRCNSNKKIQIESFYDNQDDIVFLQEELDKIEQKNNILVIFIFFLVIIVLVQYVKMNNDPIQVLLVPISNKPQEKGP